MLGNELADLVCANMTHRNIGATVRISFTLIALLALMTCVQVSQPIALVTTADQAVELAYDSGVSNTSWYKTAKGLGGYMAVRFSPTFDSCQIVSVRYYIEDKPATFNVLVLDSDRKIVYEEPVIPKAKGWFEVDLSGAHITMNGEFYVAMKWTVAESPYLGADQTKPHGRSYFVDDSTWKTYREINLEINKIDKDADFMIRAKIVQMIPVTFDVQPKQFSIRVDDSSYRGNELPKTFRWEPNSQHTLAVEQMIEGDPGVRYVFVEWSDGSKDISRTITASQAVDYTARFKTQYQLLVESQFGDPQGSGWYDEGTVVTVSVASPQPSNGPMGPLGAKRVFQRWSGDLTSDSPTATVSMDGPKTVSAEWGEDNSQPYMILGGIVAAIVVVVVVVFMVMRRKGPSQPKVPSRVEYAQPAATPPRPATPAPTQVRRPAPGEGVKYCVHCGATIPSVVLFCTKCGKKQE